ncbi:hypothetical protein DRP07_06815 [Archaeoglobales archaeon]|nr:MAG: hypothetical protein DRP07_06815 [Archaeoglobales archaeon]
MISGKIKWILPFLLMIIVLSGCVEKKELEVPKKEVNLSFKPSILVLETDSGWKVNILATLPTPCHKFEYVGKQLRGSEYYLDFSYEEPRKPCAQVITNYNRTIDLGKLEKGDYTVILRVNGEIVKKANFKVS